MKRAADRTSSPSPERTMSPGYEARGQAQQAPEEQERVPDVPEALIPEMDEIDTSVEAQAVQEFSSGYMPKPGDDATAVAEWCAEQGLAQQFVHVVNATSVPKVWISCSASLVADSLPRCPSLDEIVLDGEDIEDAEVVQLITAVSQNSTVKELFLSGCSQVSADTLKLLATMPLGNSGLRHIGVSVSTHPPDWINDLAATLTKRAYPLLALTLDDVGLKSEQLTALSAAIHDNEQLSGIELLCISFAEIEDASVLTGIVEALPQLESLNLSGNVPGSVNAILGRLGEGHRGKLHTLQLHEMKPGNADERTEWMQSMSAMLTWNTTLKTLDLRHNNLPGGPFSPDRSLLFGAIMANSALETLDLSGNSFTEAGVGQLIQALKRNLSLTSVKLDKNGVAGVPTRRQRETIEQICAYNKSKQLMCTTALIEGAVASLAGRIGLTSDIGLLIGHFAAGKTAGERHEARHFAGVDKAAYSAGVYRRSQAYGWVPTDLMRQPDGFDEITELCGALQQAGVVIHSDHMNDLVLAADAAGRLAELMVSIELSGFGSRPSQAGLAPLLAKAQSENKPGLAKALQRFGAPEGQPAPDGGGDPGSNAN